MSEDSEKETKVSFGGAEVEGDNDDNIVNIDPFTGDGTHVEGDNNGDITNVEIFNDGGGVEVDGDNNGTINNTSINTK
uniref:Uncharacterized protein n=1 Tax=Panagrolaimus sp. PS1159 TaxID=55785 RepID=A0AC35EWA5_9BILA